MIVFSFYPNQFKGLSIKKKKSFWIKYQSADINYVIYSVAYINYVSYSLYDF